MRPLRYFRILLVLGFVGILVLGSLAPLQAQNNTVTISLAVPNFTDSLLTDRLINAFETTHPGVKVSVVQVNANVPPAAQDLDKHFQGVRQYTSAADVLYVASSQYGGNASGISEEATRGGYYLDLKPLVDTDSSLNPDDFYPAIWQSFQWDQGLWALPLSADPYVLTYDPAAFDAAKLTYPSENWTMDDLANAIRQLSLKDASGKLTRAGFDVYGAQLASLFRGLLTTGYIDSGSVPNAPQFDTPEMASLLQAWLKLDQDGLLGKELNKAPLSVTPAILLAFQGSFPSSRVGVLLPGGKATLDVQGFAVSAGTQYPEQAYALASWLTTRGEIASSALGTIPARKSLVGSQASGTQAFTVKIPPDLQALMDKATANAIPLSEMRFVDYLADAYNKMKSTNADVHVALQGAQNAVIKNEQAAAAGKSTVALGVATPIPPLSLPPGKIALKFGVINYQIPNPDAWNRLVADFTVSDPQVAKVLLDKYLGTLDSLAQGLGRYDCLYAPFNGVTPDRLPKLLNLDPFLAADPTFDKSDMVGGTLAQVTFDNKIWMLPSDLSPVVLKYDSDRFSKAGVPLPGATWTIGQFVDALKTLKADATGTPGFIPTNTFGSYLFQLIAAYGGNPIDYRTSPPTINFTDPATVDAIQQVVNLAKDGDFTYHTLFGQQLDVSTSPAPSSIWQATLSAFALPLPGGSTGDKIKLTLFPQGSKFTAVTYNLGGFYISANAQSPDACYRFISKAAQTPALFSAMPARKSLLSDPRLISTQSADTVALYRQIAALLDDSNTLAFAGFSLGTSGLSSVSLFPKLELFEALDNVILKNGDLQMSLKTAETSARAFQECAVSLPPLDVTSVTAQQAYFNGFKGCASKADPALAPFFAGYQTS